MALTSPYTDNTKRPAPVATTGFKISKPGYDANRTAGNNMVFDSSWPSLPIAFEVTMNNPITGSSSTASIPHNLTFAPFAMVWYYYDDQSGKTSVSGRIIAMTDKTNIYLNGNQNPTIPFNATKIKIRAFQLDIATDIDYTLAPGDTFNMPYDNNFGVKVVKQNKDVNSRDMRDFALHSRCQSPLILAVKTQDTTVSANVVQYTSSLTYPVWVYGFIKAGTSLASNTGVPVNTYFPAPYYAQAYPTTKTDGFKSYIQWTAGANADNGATLVILRDPMFAAQQVTVQY